MVLAALVESRRIVKVVSGHYLLTIFVRSDYEVIQTSLLRSDTKFFEVVSDVFDDSV